MCKNSKTASPLYSKLQIVGEMAGLLARSRIKDDNLRKILRILCHNISADAGVLFRIEYCRSETFRIETLGHWTANDDDTAMTLSAENIPLGFSADHSFDRKVWVGFQIDRFVDLMIHRYLYYFQHLLGQVMPAPVKNCKTKPKNTLMRK